MEKGKIILNLQGTPPTKDAFFLSHGHGYYAYVNTKDSFIHTLFKDVCMWGGFTDVYHDKQKNNYYNQYELNCQHKKFFMSDMFKNICHRHSIELIICDEDNTELKKFFESVYRDR